MEIAKPFSLTINKFTKQSVYDMLLGIAQGMSSIKFDTPESQQLFTDVVNSNFKPQSGGGKSNNPSHVDPATGLMVHWCRFLQKYMPEIDMVMSGGKSKGASKLASKHNYELGKQAQGLKDEALLLFGNQDYAGGAEKNAQAKAIEDSRSKPVTYSDEVLEQYKPKAKEADIAAAQIANPTTPAGNTGAMFPPVPPMVEAVVAAPAVAPQVAVPVQPVTPAPQTATYPTRNELGQTFMGLTAEGVAVYQ